MNQDQHDGLNINPRSKATAHQEKNIISKKKL